MIYSEPAYREHVRRTDPDNGALREWETQALTGYRLAPGQTPADVLASDDEILNSELGVIILDDPPGEPHPDDDNEELRAWFETHFPARSTRPFLCEVENGVELFAVPSRRVEGFPSSEQIATRLGDAYVAHEPTHGTRTLRQIRELAILRAAAHELPCHDEPHVLYRTVRPVGFRAWVAAARRDVHRCALPL